MSFYTYILQSLKSGRLYIGQTDDLERRLNDHNSGKTKSTKNKGPWIILYYVKHESRSEAVRLELQLKKWKNKQRILRWIEREESERP